MPKLSVDQFSQRCRVRFVAGMPGLQPSELRVGRAGAGLGHLGQAQVDRVGQDRGQQQVLVLGQIARFQVREVPGEARPLIDFEQQFGDLDVRQDHGCLVYQRLRGVGHRRIQRRDLEPRQPGGCKLKTAPVRPVVAARPAEYVCSEDLFY